MDEIKKIYDQIHINLDREIHKLGLIAHALSKIQETDSAHGHEIYGAECSIEDIQTRLRELYNQLDSLEFKIFH